MTVSKPSQFEPLNRLKDEMGIPRDHYGAFLQTIHKPRAWILLPSGRRLDLLDPQPDAWTDEDLAIGLSRTYRWAGYSKWDLPLSVAQHSLAVLALREASGPLTAREALREITHDATEALWGFDLLFPLKSQLSPQFERLDDRLQAAVDRRYPLPAWTEDSYARHKHADRFAAASEAYHVGRLGPRRTCETASGSPRSPRRGPSLPFHPACSHGSPGRRSSLKHCSCNRLTELWRAVARRRRHAELAQLFSRLPAQMRRRYCSAAYRQQPHRHARLCRSRRRLSCRSKA